MLARSWRRPISAREWKSPTGIDPERDFFESRSLTHLWQIWLGCSGRMLQNLPPCGTAVASGESSLGFHFLLGKRKFLKSSNFNPSWRKSAFISFR